ncbi:MAG: EF-hand domain-containing protein [Candidatus Competibacter sp.]|nr:EF-hand domain-containing protein [Candidatus Competibacter sp.]HRD48915.1 EF-hand domain-containing protein [Candidatus Contendobacter sp.]
MKTLTKLTFVLISGLTLNPAFAAGFNMSTAQIMDANKDGNITKEEYMKQSNDMAAWAKMDTNKDGMLDANEIKAGFNDK